MSTQHTKTFVTKRRPSPTVTFLTQDELKRLVSTIKDKRDRAIILMAYPTITARRSPYEVIYNL